jgi:hypothetical protein
MPQNPGIVETYPVSMLERFNKSGSQNGKSVGRFREVLDCSSPLPLFHRSTGSVKRPRAAQSKTLALNSTAQTFRWLLDF